MVLPIYLRLNLIGELTPPGPDEDEGEEEGGGGDQQLARQGGGDQQLTRQGGGGDRQPVHEGVGRNY